MVSNNTSSPKLSTALTKVQLRTLFVGLRGSPRLFKGLHFIKPAIRLISHIVAYPLFGRSLCYSLNKSPEANTNRKGEVDRHSVPPSASSFKLEHLPGCPEAVKISTMKTARKSCTGMVGTLTIACLYSAQAVLPSISYIHHLPSKYSLYLHSTSKHSNPNRIANFVFNQIPGIVSFSLLFS